MGKMKAWEKNEALQERDYILSISPKNPSRDYNGSPSVFKRYVFMQANCLRESGFPEYAQQILNHVKGV